MGNQQTIKYIVGTVDSGVTGSCGFIDVGSTVCSTKFSWMRIHVHDLFPCSVCHVSLNESFWIIPALPGFCNPETIVTVWKSRGQALTSSSPRDTELNASVGVAETASANKCLLELDVKRSSMIA